MRERPDIPFRDAGIVFRLLISADSPVRRTYRGGWTIAGVGCAELAAFDAMACR